MDTAGNKTDIILAFMELTLGKQIICPSTKTTSASRKRTVQSVGESDFSGGVSEGLPRGVRGRK